MDAPDECTVFWTLKNGVLSAPDAEPEKTYFEIRKKEYPLIGEQFDDLYHSGVFSAEMTAKLKKVKDDNPKPE
jgi:hypothetical protein